MADTGNTRGEIKAKARALVHAFVRTAFEVDPVILNDFVDWTVANLCRVADSEELTFTTDLVDGEDTYCLPGLKYLESAQIVTDTASGSKKRPLAIRNTRSMSLADGGAWRTDPQIGIPQYAVTQGRGRIVLYPVPNYDVAGGLVLRGIGVISRDLWPLDTDICPLSPPYVHQTVIQGVAEQIAELVGNDRAAAAMKKRYLYGKSQYWDEAMTFTDEGSHRADDPSAYHLPSGPLNL